MNKRIGIALLAVLMNTTSPVLASSESHITQSTPSTTYTVKVSENDISNLIVGTSPQLQGITVMPVVTPKPAPVSSVQETIARVVTKRLGSNQVEAAKYIIFIESSYNPKAVNASSGACGLAQFLPCKGLIDDSVDVQVDKFCTYIEERYGTATAAVKHEKNFNWY
jgi:hypothetical protein